MYPFAASRRFGPYSLNVHDSRLSQRDTIDIIAAAAARIHQGKPSNSRTV